MSLPFFKESLPAPVPHPDAEGLLQLHVHIKNIPLDAVLDTLLVGARVEDLPTFEQGRSDSQ